MSVQPTHTEPPDANGPVHRPAQNFGQAFEQACIRNHKLPAPFKGCFEDVGNPMEKGGQGRLYSVKWNDVDPSRTTTLMVKSIFTDRPGKLIHDAARLQREIENLNELNRKLPDSPNVCRMIDSFTVEDRFPFLVMEFIDGRDLEKDYREHGKYRPLDVIKILLPIVDVLGAMHKSKMLYRDLSLRNIMLRGSEAAVKCQPVLLDLGLSRAEEDTNITGSAAIGTPKYMSPEQTEGRQDLTAATDVYSVGAVAYDLIAGRPPIDVGGNGGLGTLRQKKTSVIPESLSGLFSDVPEDLSTVVSRCLSINPNERFADCSQLAEAFRSILTGSQSTQFSGTAEDCIQRLNERLTGRVCIHQILDEMPQLNEGDVKPYESLPEMAEQLAESRATLAINDPHGIMLEEPYWHDTPIRFEVLATDFAELDLLRKIGRAPYVLSANCLIFSDETRSLILHRRDKACRTYPNTLHTFGGAYMPPLVQKGREDGYSLATTAERETHEEIRLSVQIDPQTKSVICTELETKFVQAMFFVRPVADWQIRAATKFCNWEGKVTRLKYDDLQSKLVMPNEWNPTAWAHVMCWLALGVPYADGGIRFAGKTAREVFDAVIKSVDENAFATDSLLDSK